MLKDENIQFINNEKNLTVVLRGEIDHHTAKEYHKRIDTVIVSNRPNSLFLDLSRVSFMDSSGLGLILGRYRLSKDLGINFKILDPADSVMKILRLTGCEKIIEIVRKKDA